jgi:chromosome partitioning protein
MLRRMIPARVVLTQMSPLQSRVASHARQEIQSANIPLLRTEVIQRAAYQSIHFTGATPAHPDGDPKAMQEVTGVLSGSSGRLCGIMARSPDWEMGHACLPPGFDS